MRAGHDIAIEVKLDAGVPIDGLKSTLHEVDVNRADDHRAVVRLRQSRHHCEVKKSAADPVA
jgi:hypothetical protein